ncbi:MAG: hypothetical protein R6U04_03185 [Bacteroidales bacterium]
MKKSIFIIASMAITLLMAHQSKAQEHWYARAGPSLAMGVVGVEYRSHGLNDAFGFQVGYAGKFSGDFPGVGIGLNFYTDGDPYTKGSYWYLSYYHGPVITITEGGNTESYGAFSLGLGYQWPLGQYFDFKLGGGVGYGGNTFIPSLDITLGLALIK